MNEPKNTKLNRAKKVKNDEFYTLYEDIEKEISTYLSHNKNIFRGKVILLPCDDYGWSNFTKYFIDNFENFGIKKLISTCFNPKYSPLLAPEERGKWFIKTEQGEICGEIEGSGDFRKKEVSKYKKEADFIITNPPFSLFRDFIDWAGHKNFIVIGPMTAILYKNVFPKIKEGGIRVGNTVEKFECNKEIVKTCNALWYSTISNGIIPNFIELKTQKENEEKGIIYPEYDNYKAIEVSKVKNIPSDYEGIMGVPISFMRKYNPEQFEILGNPKGIKDKILETIYRGNKASVYKDLSVFIGGEYLFFRIFIRHKK